LLQFLPAAQAVVDVVLEFVFRVIPQLVIDVQDDVVFYPIAVHRASPKNIFLLLA
jgi:hypothetical protein